MTTATKYTILHIWITLLDVCVDLRKDQSSSRNPKSKSLVQDVSLGYGQTSRYTSTYNHPTSSSSQWRASCRCELRSRGQPGRRTSCQHPGWLAPEWGGLQNLAGSLGAVVLLAVSSVRLGGCSKWLVDQQCQQTWLRVWKCPRMTVRKGHL